MTLRNNRQTKIRTGITLMISVCLVVSMFEARAQNDSIVENIISTAEAATPIDPLQAPDLSPPEPPQIPARDNTPLNVSVGMIRLVDHKDKVDQHASVTSPGKVITAGDFLWPGGLIEDLESTYMGKPFSMNLLDEVIVDIIKAYRDTDYPLVDAYLPEQDITEGKLQVVVREARLGAVKVEGNTHSRTDYLIRQISMQPGDRINTDILAKDIEWLHQNPKRRVEPVYEKGSVDGTSDIVLMTEDANPFGYYFSFGNTGIEATGEEEWTAGISNANLFGSEHSVAYNFNTDYDFDNLESHVVVYEMPFPWRHRLQFLGAYVLSEIPGVTGANPLDIEGESIQASLTYRMPLQKLHRKHRHNLSASIDYKSTNSDILFGGTSLFDSTGVVLQGRLEYDITIDDRDLACCRDDDKSTGYTRYRIGIVGSPGDLVYGNTDTDFGDLRTESTADYWYVTAGIDRLQRLPKDWSLRLSVDGQATSDRLITTEQIRAGGFRTVRGFDESLIRGDSGLRLSGEVISPDFQLLGLLKESHNDAIQVFGFYDSAFLYSTEIPGEGDLGQSIQAVGVGFNYEFDPGARLRFSYGKNIHDDGIIGEVEDGKVHFGVTRTF